MMSTVLVVDEVREAGRNEFEKSVYNECMPISGELKGVQTVVVEQYEEIKKLVDPIKGAGAMLQNYDDLAMAMQAMTEKEHYMNGFEDGVRFLIDLLNKGEEKTI